MKPKAIRVKAIAVFIFIFSFQSSFSQYSMEGPLNGTVFSDDNSIGNFAFSTPGNAVNSDNIRSSANALLILLNGNTHYLKVTGFGFSIPSLATITGIRVEVEKSAWDISILAWVRDNDIRLVKSGSVVGSNKATGSNWTETDGYHIYGDTTDTWGTTWTPAEINSSDFGIAFSARINGLISLIPTARIDHIRITVFYIVPLPVHFLDFRIESKRENEISLKWTTADNDERVNFTVQRSTNGSSWTDIANITGELSFSIKNYYYADQVPAAGHRYYYRIKMDRLSGASLFTKIVFTDIGRPDRFTLFPNPAKNEVYGYGSAIDTVRLFSIRGEWIQVAVEKINDNLIKINLGAIRPGLYIIQSGENKKQLLVRE